MSDIITVRCKQGKLIVTEQSVRVEFLFVKSQSISRRNLTGIDYKLVIYSIFGYGGGATLTFHGSGGERLEAGLVNPKKAREVMAILGF